MEHIVIVLIYAKPAQSTARSEANRQGLQGIHFAKKVGQTTWIRRPEFSQAHQQEKLKGGANAHTRETKAKPVLSEAALAPLQPEHGHPCAPMAEYPVRRRRMNRRRSAQSPASSWLVPCRHHSIRDSC
jgi:hypothetical protein